jgi:hypothetical protein
MKKILVLFLFFYTFDLYAVENNLKLIFNEDSAKYWQYISDRTMGGVSDGQAFLDQDEGIIFARLTGNVSTDNNGGFIQLRTTLSLNNLSTLYFNNLYKEQEKLKGVRLNVRGNGETYHIFIRTSMDRSYRDYYSATFIAGDKWQIIDLPFVQFKHRYSNQILDGNNLRTFAIVAYGREFVSDISVSEIIFY